MSAVVDARKPWAEQQKAGTGEFDRKLRAMHSIGPERMKVLSALYKLLLAHPEGVRGKDMHKHIEQETGQKFLNLDKLFIQFEVFYAPVWMDDEPNMRRTYGILDHEPIEELMRP